MTTSDQPATAGLPSLIEPFMVTERSELDDLLGDLYVSPCHSIVVTRHGQPMALRTDVYRDLFGRWLTATVSDEFYLDPDTMLRAHGPLRVVFIAMS